MRVDDDRPTLAQRIMQSRATSPANGGSNPSGRSNGSSGSQGSADQPGAGAPNTGQPFRNGTQRSASGQAPATYSPVPAAPVPPAGSGLTGGSVSSGPASQPTAPVATPGAKPGAKPKRKLDPFAAWRGPADDATATKGPPAGTAAPTAATGAAARQRSARETIVTGSTAAGDVTTGQAARGVPEPAAKKSAVSAPSSATSASSAAKSGKSDKLIVRRTRKARLRLSRVDPWSVMKTAFMFSIAAGIVLIVAVYALWSVIQASDMFTAINQIVQDALGTQGDTTPFQLETYINTPKVMGATALIAVVDVVLITALATLTAFLYNLSASVLGGLEVTLAED